MLHPAKARLAASGRVISAAGAAVREKRALAASARPAGAFDASRYFRGGDDIGFYNVGVSAIKQRARALHEETRDGWTIDEAVAFADAMLRDRYLDVKALGLELLARRVRELGPGIVPVCKRWLASNLAANWATTDSMCGAVLGPVLVAEQPLLAREMPKWARHRNLWVRRASAVALLPSIRRGLAIDLGYRVASLLHSYREDLIQKAVGWMLRELGRQDRARLERYLRANGPRIPRTTVRYAIERFPPAKRAALLKATRLRGADQDAASAGRLRLRGAD